MNLSKVPTLQLIEELKTRKGIEASEAGLFKGYELVPKYKKTQPELTSIQVELILIIKDLGEITE